MDMNGHAVRKKIHKYEAVSNYDVLCVCYNVDCLYHGRKHGMRSSH